MTLPRPPAGNRSPTATAAVTLHRMVAAAQIAIRRATELDAPVIAALHAESWRHNYRGAYSNSFLDGDVLSDREATWSERLAGDRTGDTRTVTFLAETPGPPAAPVGFAHVVFDADPEWGSLLDNLHVAHNLKRSGIGTRLIAEAARAALEHEGREGREGGHDGNDHPVPLHLYVLEQNTNAQAFYRARGGRFVESSFVRAPGGVASRLNGTPKGHLYVWDDASVLLPQHG